MDASETATNAAIAVDWNATILDSSAENVERPPSEDELWVGHVRFAIEGVAQGIVALIGLVGNILSIAVLCRRDMDLKPAFRQILITLVSFDIGCIVFNVMLFCLPQISAAYYSTCFPYIVPYVLPFAQISLTGSIYSTLAVAIERYISVCHPLTKPNANTGVYTIAGLVVFSVAFNVCRFLEFETTYETVTEVYWSDELNVTVAENVTVARASQTALRSNPVYTQVTMIIIQLISGIIPLVVLIGLNTRIYVEIKKRMQRLASMSSRQRRDVDVAAVLVGIILVFIVCHSFKFFVNCYEAYVMHYKMDMASAWSAAWTNAVVSFSHLLATLNSSLNFVIYCYKDAKFRESLINMLCGTQRNTVTNGGGGRGNTRNGTTVAARRKNSSVPTESTKMAATKV